MFITALCPTYRCPALVQNVLALWNLQDYPVEQRRLIILDDGGTFIPQKNEEEGWELYCIEDRIESLPAKYNMMWQFLAPPETEAFAVWEHDDIYLPRYLSLHAAALQTHGVSKPAHILTDYPGHLQLESGEGRMHSSMAFRKEILEAVGGWTETKRPDFDLQMVAKIQIAGSTRDPWFDRPGQFIYGWHTSHPHAQNAMRGDDAGWYERSANLYQKVETAIETVVPLLDERTTKLIKGTEAFV